MQESRRRSSRQNISLGVGLFLLVAVLTLVNVIAARHSLRADWTRGAVFSLADKTKRVLRGLQQPIQVTVLMAAPDRFQESLYYDTRELLRRFAAESSRVRVEHVDIDANAPRAALLASRFGVRKADLREGVVVFARGERAHSVHSRQLAEYELSARGRRMKSFHGEAALLSALLSVTTDERSTVCFSSGHDEAVADSYADAGYGYIWDEVRRENYATRTADATELARGLKGCDVLVMGGPKRGFAEQETRGLERYLSAGGRLFLLSGPLLDRKVTRFGETGLQSLLARWGVGLSQNIVVDPLAVPGEQPLLTWATEQGYGSHPIGRALSGRLTVWPLTREVRPLPEARPGLQTARVVSSSGNGWAETDLASLRGDGRLSFDAAVDTRGPVSVAVAVRSGRTRIVVFGSERVVLNRRLGRQVRRDFNRDLFLAVVGWLAGKERMVAVGPKTPEHARLLLDDRIIERVFLLSVVGLPLLSLCVALLVWWRRHHGDRPPK